MLTLLWIVSSIWPKKWILSFTHPHIAPNLYCVLSWCFAVFFLCLMAYGHTLVLLYGDEQLRHSPKYLLLCSKEVNLEQCRVFCHVHFLLHWLCLCSFLLVSLFFSLSVSFPPIPHFISAACSCALHQSWNGIMGNISPPHWMSVPACPSGNSLWLFYRYYFHYSVL